MGCLTLGLYPLLAMVGERHFIRRMDEEGVETRGGTRIAWQEFTRVEHVQGTMKGNTLSDEFLFQSPKGRVSLPMWRTVNAQEALDFALAHVPAAATGQA
jgi:hypothetical protein